MARSLWICPRHAISSAEEKQEDEQGRQAGRKTDRKGGGCMNGEVWGGDVPSGALARTRCHMKRGSIRVGRGEEREVLFFFFGQFSSFNQAPSALTSSVHVQVAQGNGCSNIVQIASPSGGCCVCDRSP